jgi:hypothetical protein
MATAALVAEEKEEDSYARNAELVPELHRPPPKAAFEEKDSCARNAGLALRLL